MLRSAALPVSTMAIVLTLLLLPMPGRFSASAEIPADHRLRQVAGTNDVNEVRALLARGASPNVPDLDGRTAVHAAAAKIVHETLEALLEAGGDPNRRDKDGNTPLHLASAAPPLLSAVPTILLLLEAGGDPDISNGEGRTALHLAAVRHERPAAIEAMLSRGADPNRKDRWGSTPLHASTGPNPGWPGWPGLAAPGAVGALLAGGADPRLADGRGLTALQRLVRSSPDQGRTAAMLLSAGADPDRKYANGDTMLHTAIRRSTRGFVDIARALLAGGADPCLRDAKGYLPYQVAEEGGIIHGALDREGGDEFTCRRKARTAGLEKEPAASLDSNQWRRIQSALARQGFDPGPVDGRPGPRTRSAISGWQRSRGYADNGSLTDAQAGELLSAAPAMEPLGRDWIVVRNQACQLWNGGSMTGDTAVWQGGCTGGKASGEGRAEWRSSFGPESYEGPMRSGKAHGYGVARFGDDRYEGDFRNGVRHGRGTMTWASGDRYEGGWRDDLMHGQGTFTDRNSRYEGGYRDGKMHGRGTRTTRYGGRSSTYSTCDGRWSDSCPSAERPPAGSNVAARTTAGSRKVAGGAPKTGSRSGSGKQATPRTPAAVVPESKCAGHKTVTIVGYDFYSRLGRCTKGGSVNPWLTGRSKTLRIDQCANIISSFHASCMEWCSWTVPLQKRRACSDHFLKQGSEKCCMPSEQIEGIRKYQG